MGKYIKFIAICWVGVGIWCALGITLEHFGLRPMYFMLAGFWVYPLFSYINKFIME